MKLGRKGCAAMLGLVWLLAGRPAAMAMAGDLDDGISKATDDPIDSYDTLKDKDTNINFIVVDAIGKAKASQFKAKQQAEGNNSQASGQDGGESKQQENKSKSKKNKINYCDGKGDSNENSIVFEPGSKADTVILVVDQ